jgi:hypothetical protein
MRKFNLFVELNSIFYLTQKSILYQIGQTENDIFDCAVILNFNVAMMMINENIVQHTLGVLS